MPLRGTQAHKIDFGVRFTISVPVQDCASEKSAREAYSIAAVTPQIFPSAPPAEVGGTADKLVGAAGPSALAMLQEMLFAVVVPSFHT